MGLSGPDLQFITHLVVNGCMQLTSDQVDLLGQNSSPELQRLAPARKFIVILDYDTDPLSVEVVNVEDSAEVSRLCKRATALGVTGAWRA